MLSGPHQKFAERIVAGDNGTLAYRCAYPKCSAKAAEPNASRLLRKAKVAAEIQRLRSLVQEEFSMSRADWLEELCGIGQEARAAKDFSAATQALRQIGLAMPNWYGAEKIEHGPQEIIIHIGK